MSHHRNQTGEIESCTAQEYRITHQELPLSCPLRDERVWDAHPKVYLPIEETGKITCPYCGTRYVLEGFVPPHPTE